MKADKLLRWSCTLSQIILEPWLENPSYSYFMGGVFFLPTYMNVQYYEKKYLLKWF